MWCEEHLKQNLTISYKILKTQGLFLYVRVNIIKLSKGLNTKYKMVFPLA